MKPKKSNKLSLLSSLDCIQPFPIIIYENNQPAINLSKNPGDHRHSKHIDVQFHYTHELVELGEIEIVHGPFYNQMADIMTKPSSRDQFLAVRNELLHPF
jgi:hypothetical protein